ncbi:hypothetical protein HDU84_009031 [Entophlyctis sp. JEL0112]|nr:hypothetical protein HDU84_009031 [Entophlyctis sp. JEL0112]
MPNIDTGSERKHIAIIGSGISGLSAAWLLSRNDDLFRVTLLEKGSYFGGHSHTVDVRAIDGSDETVGVDTGFIVCNPVTYPNFLAFLKELGVPLQRSDMSFAMSRNRGEFEWNGNNLNSLFAQRSNLFSFNMWKMIASVLAFNAEANAIAESADSLEFDNDGIPKENVKCSLFSLKCKILIEPALAHPYARWTLGEFFKKFGFSKFFYQNYVVPMTAAIWSTPANMTFDKFPLLTLVRFMRNHVLLTVLDRPHWMTVDGGSRTYVERVVSDLTDARLNVSIKKISRKDGKVKVQYSGGTEEVFDHVIIATHTDEALEILGDDATDDEKRILGGIEFLNNRAVLHRDKKLMPKRRLAWASWNYLTEISNETDSQTMCLTYWMDNLQPYINVEKFGHVFVTMNPLYEPDPSTVIGEWQYTHPLYSPKTIAAQDALNVIQNNNLTTFAGAWTNYGFHEDGITSGLLAATSLGAKCPFEVSVNGGYPTKRVPMNPPKWAADLGVQRYVPAKPVYANAAMRKRRVADIIRAGKIEANKGEEISPGFIQSLLVVVAIAAGMAAARAFMA